MIEIIVFPGSRNEIDIEVGSTVEELLKAANISISANQAVFVAGHKVEKSDYSKVHILDGVVIIASGVKGHAPTPKLKNTINYLKSLKFFPVEGGKGDHQKFKNNEGTTILLNRDNHDKQHICLGSAKSLCKYLGISLNKLYARIE